MDIIKLNGKRLKKMLTNGEPYSILSKNSYLKDIYPPQVDL